MSRPTRPSTPAMTTIAAVATPESRTTFSAYRNKKLFAGPVMMDTANASAGTRERGAKRRGAPPGHRDPVLGFARDDGEPAGLEEPVTHERQERHRDQREC